jgi:hypothetical protein
LSEEDIQVEVEAAVMVDGQVPEEIVALDAVGEAVHDPPVLSKVPVDEVLNLLVVKEQILVIRIEKLQVAG